MASISSKDEQEEAPATCLICGGPEEDDYQMVSCEKCKLWGHFKCAGVSEEVKDKNVAWFCPKCLPSTTHLRVPKPPKKTAKKSGSKSDAGSVRSTGSVLDTSIQQLEEEQLAKEKALEMEMAVRVHRLELARALHEKQLKMERKMRELELQAEQGMQEEKLKLEQELLDRQLATEQEFLKKRDAIREKLHRSQKTIKELSKKEGDVRRSKVPVEAISDNKVRNWLSEQEHSSKKPGGDYRCAYPKGKSSLFAATKPKGGQSVSEGYSAKDDEVSNVDDDDDDDETVEEDSEDQIPNLRDRLENGPGQIARVTKDQLAARQAVSKHLPTFRGEPEVWPLFISSFMYTTEACGFSNLDNLKRLQDSLQGDALEAVRSRLVLPGSVPDVINDLRNLFGRPEKLLKTLLMKVRGAQAPRADRLETFIHFGITVKQLCDHLEAAQLIEHLSNPMLVQELVEKLPPSYKLDWVRYKRGKRNTPLRVFTDFMTDIVSDVSEVSEFSGLSLNEPARITKANHNRKKEFIHLHDSVSDAHSTKPSKPCWFCKRTDHKLRFCDEFKKMNVAERLKAVEKLKLCSLCLNSHGNSRCNFKLRCTIRDCGGNHHPLLHRAEESVQLMEVECNTHKNVNQAVIFRMVPVTLHAGDVAFNTLAFLDEGSSSTFVNEAVAKRLQAKGKPEPLIVTWTGNVKRYENNSRKISLMLSAKDSREKFLLENVRTVSGLVLPKQSVRFSEVAERFPHLDGLPVADHTLEEPTILIGLDNLHLFAPLESRVGSRNEPIAVRTSLGWTVYGPGFWKATAETFLNLHCMQPATNQELHDMMRAQYVLDEAGVSSFAVPEPADDQRAREILQATTNRVGNRFETGLLWREEERRFPDSYPMAMRRMIALERKLERNPVLKQNVCMQIDDYQIKGYAHKATVEELAGTPRSAVWYLPLNVVLNPRKPGKIRLVWDAAAAVNGISLNSELLKGPDMLVPLPGVICRFRERPVGYGGDIAEMYHQILIRPEDKSAQRFLFRTNPVEVPQVYVMDVATFGSTCSPCSAQYVKNLNAGQFAETYPEASAAIEERHYVDDYYDSVDTVEEAIKRAKEVKYIHSQGGFQIRNWVSNSGVFLEELGERSGSSTVHFNRDKGTEYERVLGIVWDQNQDIFSFATGLKTDYHNILHGGERPTKRMVLSCVMALFDPLGLLSPFTVLGRMLVQDLWRTGCGWDDRINDESYDKWERWSRLLPDIEEFKVQRCYFGDAKSDEIEDLELHIFTDASETAYGCVAYFRAAVRGEIKCALVMSRSKVAPLKQISIPRLELLAAVLGARLAKTVHENHSFKIVRTFFWTDSQTVLSWIRSDQRRYKQFVGFRIGEILSLTRVMDWYWVPTRLNVADQLTKWGKFPELQSESAWVHGPSFLYQREEDWPKTSPTPANTVEELRVHLLLHDLAVPEVVIDARRFSKWNILVRTMACVYRFVSNCRRKTKGLVIETVKATNRQKKILNKYNTTSVLVSLQQEEYQKAELFLMKMAQIESYVDEYKVLLRNKDRPVDQWLAIEKSSPLYTLTPLVDEDNLIRMDGRAERADSLPFDLRFPIILPKDHPITKHIVQYYHEKFGHGYRETVKNELKQKFYIPSITTVVQKVSSQCVWCKVHRNRPQNPRMAPLPVQRLTPYLRPFSYVGVDYLGPIEVTVARRTEKRWVALFTCMVTRAVHLEVAHGLTTQSCLMAIRRFICRRGPPLEFFSDNGTNLRGASKEVVGTIRRIGNECAEEFTNARTKWTFNPPVAPHFGGVWERLVRSVKEALVVLDDGERLTDEVLHTSCLEAEDMINSRPLTYVTQQSEEVAALSPNHFLRGVSPNEPLMTPPPPHPAEALRDAYKRTQKLATEFWERWIKEYVPSLNRRTEWFGESRPLRAGDLVYLVDGKNRKLWIRGVVVEPIMSGDGRIRQAMVRTSGGVFKRATARLAVLEIDDGNAGPNEVNGPGLRAGEMLGTPLGCLPALPTEDDANRNT